MIWWILGSVAYVLIVGSGIVALCGGAKLADDAFPWIEDDQHELDLLERLGRL